MIGVHTPEYAFEHDAGNVAAGAKRLGITYPVALDNDYKTWNNFSNESWPADYLVDATGTIRDVTIILDYHADDIYLDVGGTGTITATVDGATTSYPVSGAPNIYTVLHRTTEDHGTLRVALSQGLSAYSFTFG